MNYKLLDLFCGAGGFSLGFTSTFKGTHLAIDIDSEPLETLTLNQKGVATLRKDISTLHSNEIIEILGGTPDIVIASPPCEEFSLANPNSDTTIAERIYGSGVARLLLDTIRLIGDLSPRVFVIENVAALLHGGGKLIIETEFERVGITNVKFHLIRSHQYGNPSKRLRVFISNIDLNLPRSKAPEVMDVLADLPQLCLGAVFTENPQIPNHELRPLTEDRLKQVRKTRRGHGAKHFRVSKKKSLPNWVRLYPDQISSSIIGLSRYIHPYEDRLLTVREHARLMSYPDDYIFTGHMDSQYNQVGESVPPLISKLIAEEVKSYIE
jgi:DNA (cytosine-5)-methyltransferase 1